MTITPTLIPGLRSPYEMLGGIYHFGRMLDKIRIHAKGQLPEAWVSAMGATGGFDGYCCRLLGISYPALQIETLRGGTDESLLEWAMKNGHRPSDETIEIWNAFVSKRCWRDKYHDRLLTRLAEVGRPSDAVLTMFDFINLDEGRPVRRWPA